MKSFLLLPIALLASAAAAQTTQTTTECGADYIVEACLSSEEPKLAACTTTDYECLCAGAGAVATCYNNCPNDPRKHSAISQRDLYCGYVTQFPSKTPTVATTVAPATKTATGADAEETGDDAEKTGEEKADDEPAATSTGATPSTSPNAAAGEKVMGVGSVLAAVAGVVAVVF